MKIQRTLFCLFLFYTPYLDAQRSSDPALIPQPVSITKGQGFFKMNKGTKISFNPADKNLINTKAVFIHQLNFIAATATAVTSIKNEIKLDVNKLADTSLGKEGYNLLVTPQSIHITANTDAGIFYGLETLLQLIPVSAGNGSFHIPAVKIKDYPRFGWRGLMLDVSRHFFTKDEVKQYIDEMARYKFNVFHWHLSDDNGWRVEIKSLPQLTAVGAWRVMRTGNFEHFNPAEKGEQSDYGGYYTQDDIKEIVQYAADRHIRILPEIDIPAHSLALIASYPNLSCTQLQYAVDPGSNFYKKLDNALCVGNDSVYTVLDKIFTEIAGLFPGEYIHMGGDEAYKGFWKTCPKCNKRMTDEHLANVDELQSYFVKRVEKIIQSKGKKLIGWDEILDGGIAPGASVMSWRGIEGGKKAASMKHDVVMSPWGNTYLDLYQGDPSAEPPTYGMCRLSDCYNFEPAPAGIDARYILGGQGNLWTESVPTFRHAQYMTWPRAMALAEVYWSLPARKNWNDFIRRMESQFPVMDAANIKYAKSCYNAIIQPVKDTTGKILSVKLATEINGMDIYYTFDGTSPDNFSAKYKGEPLFFPVGARRLKAIAYRHGKSIGKEVNLLNQ
ncbi:MAG: family 20 glycosylhydrolase [Bacteroidota bacterium]